AGIQPLVDRAMAALKNAGVMPQVFGFPTVTDGIAMGTEGMKYSLVSREVIADSIEVAVNGQCMDGVLCVGGCDKNMPGSMMATGGSTNAVLHYLAIAAAAEVEWAIDDFERVRKRVPVLCELKPSGRFVATDFHAAGGVPQVLRMLLDHDLLHGNCMTITGKT